MFETEYVTDDSFEILCTVTIVKQSLLKSEKFKTVMVPPCNLGQQLCQLLESGKGADVTFEVGGEFFKAHKPILAAMSPVFSAQFFGLMNDKGVESIKLDDIEPEIFRVLLHFIYFGSLTEVDEKKPETMILYQQLLVAADRYGVERLKIICESKLTQNIEVINFATTLTLAEQHNCSQLKASCLDFVSSLKMLVKVMQADGFEYLNQSFPFILKELLENTSDDN